MSSDSLKSEPAADGLAAAHQRLLDNSAISAAVAAARGYRTVVEDVELERLGFARTQRLGSGLLIPIYGVDGQLQTHQYRPDSPRLNAKGKPRKYECPARRPVVLDVPRSAFHAIGNPNIPLWVTEGARKADAAVSVDLPCISLSGVWSWRGSNRQGGKVALPDWESVALNGRVVYLCFDSDVMTKAEVAKALGRLTAFLESKRATVHSVYLPAGPGEKVGLDDFLATHGRAALLDLASKGTPLRASVASSSSRSSPTCVPCTLAELEKVFRDWIPTDDPVPMRAVLATYVANRHLDGDPIWTMLVGGSGIGKTERLVSMAVMEDVILASSITGPAALLSGTSQKERAKDATGGLLRRVPEGGHLLLKDFTSILEMHRDTRAEILAALREIHDGRWDREVGSDGGRTLSWTGRLGLIAGCTSAIDTAHEVIGQMGPRFVLVRLTRDKKIAAAAFRHEGEEKAMRMALRGAVAGLLNHLPGQPFDKAGARDPILALACYVALARSPVARRMGGDITLVMDEEAPTRMTKTLLRFWRASGVLGLNQADAWSLIERVGLDSIPKLRRAILDDLASRSGAATTTDIAESVRHPTQTTRRSLEDLAAHQMIVRLPAGAGKADRWELAAQTRDWRDQMTVPLMSAGVEGPTPDPRSEDHHTASSTPADISGTVGSDSPMSERSQSEACDLSQTRVSPMNTGLSGRCDLVTSETPDTKETLEVREREENDDADSAAY